MTAVRKEVFATLRGVINSLVSKKGEAVEEKGEIEGEIGEETKVAEGKTRSLFYERIPSVTESLSVRIDGILTVWL